MSLMTVVLLVVVFSLSAGQVPSRLPQPPSMTVMPNDTIYFTHGQTVHLPCKANGSPTPVYTWERNNQPFSPTDSNGHWQQKPGEGTLACLKPGKMDEAIYQCYASNLHGVAVSVKISLVEASLSDFPEVAARTLKHALGDDVVLRCTPPRSVPDAEIFWTRRYRYGLAIPRIEESSRFLVDDSGSLYIRNLTALDAPPGLGYVCVATNSFACRVSTASPLYFETYKGGQDKAVSILWRSPSVTKGLIGGRIKLKCIFAGSAGLEVRWSRYSRDSLPFREGTSVQHSGMVLVFDDLQLEDAGQYSCMGFRQPSGPTVTATFTLIIEASPVWKIKPEEKDMDVGTSGTLTCSGVGIPTPSLHITVNGKAFGETDGDGRMDIVKMVNGNQTTAIVSFRNLTLRDSKVLQCNISNKHGYIFTNTYINVLGDIRDASTTPATRSDVLCGSQGIRVEIPVSLLSGDDITNGFALQDPTCRLSVSDGKLVADFGFSDCGTMADFTSDTIIYKNFITPLRGGDSVPVICTYPRYEDVTLPFAIAQRSVRFYEKGVGSLEMVMRQYNSSTYQTEIPASSYPIFVNSDEPVYLEVSLTNGMSNGLIAFPTKCLASESASPMANAPSRKIIKNGCEADSSVVFLLSPPGKMRFRFNAFSLSPKSRVTYVHCEMLVCRSDDRSSKCQPDCSGTAAAASGRAKRSPQAAAERSGHFVSRGPLVLDQRQTATGSSLVGVFGVVAVVGMVVAMVAVAVATITVRRRRSKFTEMN